MALDTPFQQYIKDHPELEAKNAFKVFRVYNSEMREQDAQDQFILEIEDYIDRYESTPVLEELLNPSAKQPELPLEPAEEAE